jgi:hypothetical protein
MGYVEWLAQQIAPRIRSGEIGQAVFLRANFEIAADHGLLVPVAAEALEAAVGLLGGSVYSVYAQGGVREGYVSLLVEFSGGETALLGAELSMDHEPSARVHVSGRPRDAARR